MTRRRPRLAAANLDRRPGDGARRRRPANLARLAETAAGLARARGRELEGNREAVQLAAAYPGRTDDPGRGSGPSRPTERAALSRDAAAATEYDRATDQLVAALARWLKSADQLLPVDVGDPPPPGAGHCLTCARWVTGSTSDKLRAGLCDACRKAVDRARRADPTLDRHGALEARRAQLDELEAGPGHA